MQIIGKILFGLLIIAFIFGLALGAMFVGTLLYASLKVIGVLVAAIGTIVYGAVVVSLFVAAVLTLQKRQRRY